MNSEASELLDDMGALRRRTRRDRSGYWLPLLLFGALILAAPLVYREPKVTSDSQAAVLQLVDLFSTTLHIGRFDYEPFLLFNGQPLPAANAWAVILYWFGTLVAGTLVTVLWYRWRAARVGVQLRLRPYLWWSLGGLAIAVVGVPVLVQSTLYDLFGVNTAMAVWISVTAFVVGLGLALLSANAGRSWPRIAGLVIGVALVLVAAGNIGVLASTHGFGVLLVIAAGVAGLALAERSRLCGAIAVLFTGAALLANLYDMENIFYRWFGVQAYDLTAAVPYNLVLPGLVLVVGGLVALITNRSHRHSTGGMTQ